jgi:hypothetical protein
MLNEKSMFRITENMLKDGGSFTRTIAKAYRLADPTNASILRSAFLSLFRNYDYE